MDLKHNGIQRTLRQTARWQQRHLHCQIVINGKIGGFFATPFSGHVPASSLRGHQSTRPRDGNIMSWRKNEIDLRKSRKFLACGTTESGLEGCPGSPKNDRESRPVVPLFRRTRRSSEKSFERTQKFRLVRRRIHQLTNLTFPGFHTASLSTAKQWHINDS